MSSESKSFPHTQLIEPGPSLEETGKPPITEATPLLAKTAWTEVAIVYGLIEAAIWTEDITKLLWTVLATACALIFVFRRKPSLNELGLDVPPLKGSLWTLTLAAILASGILLAGWMAGTWDPRHPTWPPLQNPDLYAAWALVQQFLLQIFFYKRLEVALGNSRLAVLATALLFSAAHIPNPWLVPATLFGGLFFCELFRRYRNLYPLGAAHALLGFAVAEALSVVLLRHMRVGIGYLHS
ncbi:MAG TPA: CPBP family intramembrane glutamic endopeptidase [Terriglobales bacterium]|nr:CPBP family intramembrane glutamic endopeptidase [Terriglobales bacterium]